MILLDTYSILLVIFFYLQKKNHNFNYVNIRTHKANDFSATMTVTIQHLNKTLRRLTIFVSRHKSNMIRKEINTNKFSKHI